MKKNIAIFGDISTNGIDGSSIWLQSICSIFPPSEFQVYLILRDPIETRILLDGFINVEIINLYDNPYLIDKTSGSCSPYELFTIISGLDKSVGLDHIILRAPRYLLSFIEKAKINNAYKKILLKIDAYFARISLNESYDSRIIGESVPYLNRLIVQTEESRTICEDKYPELVGRIIVLNPMIPDFSGSDKVLEDKEVVSIIYSGKLDKTYCVEEFIDLANANTNKYKSIIIGSKVNSNKEDKLFPKRVLAKLESKTSLEWVKQVSRENSIKMIQKATFIMAVRDKCYDDNVEISTKLLESMSVGCLPILRKNISSLNLIGEDYPYFVDSVEELSSLNLRHPDYSVWVNKLQGVAKNYTFTDTYEKNLSYFYADKSSVALDFDKPLRILIASHDNKFLMEVIDFLSKQKNLIIKFDLWTATNKHNLVQSKDLLEWADIVLCEWAVGPAVFYSQNKRDGQKLLVRLHRFEITTELPKKIKVGNVDKFIVVSDYLKTFCIDNYQWPESKIKVLPQYANTQHFNRPKVTSYNTQYNLGILGIVPKLKRLDRAIEIIKQLRTLDSRYVLHIKSKMPWEIPFIWSKPEERKYYTNLFSQIENDPILKSGVVFHSYGNNVSSWLRKIGWILSTSEIEGCHTAVAEAMSAGTKPIIFNWPGAETVYKESPIFSDSNKVAEYILSENQTEKLDMIKLKKFSYDNFDITHTLNAYMQFIVESK